MAEVAMASEEGAVEASAKELIDSMSDEEVIEVFISDSIEELTDSQPEGLEWLDEHRYMLQQYSPEEGHTRPMTAFIEQEPSVN